MSEDPQPPTDDEERDAELPEPDLPQEDPADDPKTDATPDD